MAGKSAVFIIAPENFRDEEYSEPKAVLESAGIKVVTASKGVKQAKGSLGSTARVDIDISSAKADDYDAVVFVGGAGAQSYFADSSALNLAKSAYEKGKVAAAICIAPSILANAGILAGKKATCFASEAENLKQHGAEYTGRQVEADGKIVTASGPKAAREFGEKILDSLEE